MNKRKPQNDDNWGYSVVGLLIILAYLYIVIVNIIKNA